MICPAKFSAGNSELSSRNSSRNGGRPHILQLTLAKPADLQLGWLDNLPHAETLCAHLCLKGMQCGSAPAVEAMKSLRHMRVHECVEEPGGHENGHEGVCAYRFLLDVRRARKQPRNRPLK